MMKIIFAVLLLVSVCSAGDAEVDARVAFENSVCECVPYFQCNIDGLMNDDGEGIIDIRNGFVGTSENPQSARRACDHYLSVCCLKEELITGNDVSPVDPEGSGHENENPSGGHGNEYQTEQPTGGHGYPTDKPSRGENQYPTEQPNGGHGYPTEQPNGGHGNGYQTEQPTGGQGYPTEQPNGGHGNGYQTEQPNGGQGTEQPNGGQEYPTEQPNGEHGNGYQTEQPTGGQGYPTEQPTGGQGYPTEQPTGGQGYPTEQPNGGHGNGYQTEQPTGGQGYPTEQPNGGQGYPTEQPNGGHGNGYQTEQPTGGQGYPTEQPNGGQGYPTEQPNGGHGNEYQTEKPTGGQEHPTEQPAGGHKLPTHKPYASKGCGFRNPNGVGFRITGAFNNEANFAEFPWMTAVMKTANIDGNVMKAYQCGGSLIHPRVILTAAHCVYGKTASELTIRAGEWDTQTVSEALAHQDRAVSTVIMHPRYNNKNLHYDFALLILETPVELAENVELVCLPESNEYFDNSKCFATGWGKNEFGDKGKYQVILKAVELPAVQHAQCQHSLRETRLGRYFKLDQSFMCAGGVDGIDTCTGDGGSPLVCPLAHDPTRYTQAGIVAWGIGCGKSGVPGVYGNVAKARQWIDEQLAFYNIDSQSYTPSANNEYSPVGDETKSSGYQSGYAANVPLQHPTYGQSSGYGY